MCFHKACEIIFWQFLSKKFGLFENSSYFCRTNNWIKLHATNIVFAFVLYFCKKQKDMPTNKNALIRYKYLDGLLSDHHHFYDIHDLTEKVNDMLYEDGYSEVTQRCIEKDLVSY